MEKGTIRSFQMPRKAATIEEAIDCLAEFYKGLGWSFEKELLETDAIFISKENYTKISDMYFMIPGISVREFNATILAYMPNIIEDLSNDFVVIQEGAFKLFEERDK